MDASVHVPAMRWAFDPYRRGRRKAISLPNILTITLASLWKLQSPHVHQKLHGISQLQIVDTNGDSVISGIISDTRTVSLFPGCYMIITAGVSRRICSILVIELYGINNTVYYRSQHWNVDGIIPERCRKTLSPLLISKTLKPGITAGTNR